MIMAVEQNHVKLTIGLQKQGGHIKEVLIVVFNKMQTQIQNHIEQLHVALLSIKQVAMPVYSG